MGRDLIPTWLRKGEWNHWVMIEGFLEHSDRFMKEVCRTGECDVNLLERLFPSFFLVEGLKTAVMLLKDRLLRLQH
jgi:hypothetical protein